MLLINHHTQFLNFLQILKTRICGLQETTDEYPPKIGTIYKNRWDTPTWDCYKVVEFEQDKLFTLSDMNDDYHVRYTYKAVGEKTEMEYFEWVTEGELSNPYMKEVLEQLKSIMETG